MNHLPTHKERVEKVKNFAGENKVFTIFSVIIVLVLIFNFFFSKVNKEEINNTSDKTSQYEYIDENQNAEEKLQWQFYWIDLWILIIGGGFCVIMIVRERKKARENL